jgi:hypothetical protein
LDPRPLPHQTPPIGKYGNKSTLFTINDSNYADFSKEWKAYLPSNYSAAVVKSYYSCGLNYANLLFSTNRSSLKLMSPEKRLCIVKALCAVSKFVRRCDTFKQLVKAYDLKWSTGNKDSLILRRVLRPKNQDNDIKQWIQTVKQKVELYLY